MHNTLCPLHRADPMWPAAFSPHENVVTTSPPLDVTSHIDDHAVAGAGTYDLIV